MGVSPDAAEYEQLKRKLPRRARPPFTTARSYLPLLRLMEQSKTINESLNEFSLQGLDLDQRHAERGVKRLRELMTPQQDGR